MFLVSCVKNPQVKILTFKNGLHLCLHEGMLVRNTYRYAWLIIDTHTHTFNIQYIFFYHTSFKKKKKTSQTGYNFVYINDLEIKI